MINFVGVCFSYSKICRFKYYYKKLCKKVNVHGKFNNISVNLTVGSIHITPQLHVNVKAFR